MGEGGGDHIGAGQGDITLSGSPGAPVQHSPNPGAASLHPQPAPTQPCQLSWIIVWGWQEVCYLGVAG